MSSRDAIKVVARREISSRVRERSFLISTLVTLLAVVLAGVAPALIGGDGPQEVEVVAGDRDGRTIVEVAAQRDAALDLEVVTRSAATAADAERMVRDEDVDVAVFGDRLVVQEELDAEAGVLLQQASAAVRQTQALADAGVDAADRDAILQPPALDVDELDPGAGDDDEKVALATIAAIVLYGQLLVVGFSISTGIVEEKASRIVEVLLAAIRPWVLLTGKLLGLGLLGVGQLLLIGIAGAGAIAATGSLDVPSGAWEAVGVVLAFFLFGYTLYAAMFAVAGAIVPRQEDIGTSTTPLMIIILLSFFASLGAANDTDGTVAQVLTFVPFSAPIIMPVRLIAGDVAVWETVVSVAIVLGTATALMAVAVRIYTNAILRTGGRVKLLDAWRAS